MVAKKTKTVKKDPISTEFLIQTLASIQAALSSIDKESVSKTEALNAVLDNINSMADMMKFFHDQNLHDANKLVQLSSDITDLRSDIKLIVYNDDIKEIKYALQELNKNLAELKVVKQTKEEIMEDEKAKEAKKGEGKDDKKFNFFSFIKKAIEILSNLKTILIVVLIIILLVGSLFYGPSVIQTFLEIFKVTSGS
jgi:hypothetical protein